MRAKGASDGQKKRNREAADWFLRNSDPDQSQSEKTRFREWLDRDPENCRTYSAAERLMGDVGRAIQSDSALASIEVKSRRSSKPVILTLLVVAVAAGAFSAVDGPMRLAADAIAGTDEMPIITLEDGSEVQLNSSSMIAIDFTERRRTVRLLRGQAFFQVAHAVDRPFTVVAGTARVTALGTAFDVRYGKDDTEVTVTENAVRIETDGNGDVRIGQGEQATFDYAKKEMAILPMDSLTALAWRRGEIVLDNAPLSYVVEEMNRHFYGRVIFTDSALANHRVSGTMNIANTDNALAFITQALHVKATRLGPLILISK